MGLGIIAAFAASGTVHSVIADRGAYVTRENERKAKQLVENG